MVEAGQDGTGINSMLATGNPPAKAMAIPSPVEVSGLVVNRDLASATGRQQRTRRRRW